MKTINISFYECEHDGDLRNYEDDVRASGGKVVSSRCDSDSETGTMTVEVEDIQDFKKKFLETDACGFSSFRF